MNHRINSQTGYSLAEVITTIAVLSILLGISIPNLSQWVIKNEINAESQKLYLDLQAARAFAVKNNNNVVVTFNAGGPSYTIHDDTDSDGTVDGGENVKTIPINPRVKFGYNGSIVDVDGNAVTSSVFLSGGGSQVTFLSNGQSNLSGSAYLIHANDEGKNNGRLRSVTIVQATGEVDLWKYDAGVNPPWN